MKRYMGLSVIIFLMNVVFFSVNSVQAPYDIQITTYGDDALVQAIQYYSNLTKADVDRWKYSWAPSFIRDYIRNGIAEKIRSLVTVGQSLVFVHSWFQNSNDFIQSLPANWTVTRVCLALKNLEKQAEYALALLAQIGTITDEEKQWKGLLDGYIKNIRYNKQLLGCDQLKQMQQTKEARKLQIEKNRQEFNKLYWKSFYIQWKMAKDMSQSAFKGLKWIIQTVHEYSTPATTLVSAATLLFIYNKMFELPQKVE